MNRNNKHKNYEILNLIGYGLAKFDNRFIKFFGFNSKSSFYKYIVALGVAETIGVIKNRQDLFDPFFDNKRKGWWQKGDTYKHRKILIDNLFGHLDLPAYANIIKLFLKDKYKVKELTVGGISPVFKSRFKQLQMTGLEAEEYFINNYRSIELLKEADFEDARRYGDGYDFQFTIKDKYLLVEVKGIRTNFGGVRLTEKEYKTANEYKKNYGLAVVSNLVNEPKIHLFFNPLNLFHFNKKSIVSNQTSYHIGAIKW